MNHKPTLNELTDREIEVLLLLAQGRRNQHIAQILHITVRTVKFHTGNIYAKLGCESRSEAIVWTWTNIIRKNDPRIPQ